MDGPEWNYTALSPKKRELGELLVKRLRARFAPGGFLHFGQGKWYPGEPLPRWALGIYWRIDGQPLWRHDELIADTTKSGAATVATAQMFGERLAAALGLPSSLLITAYEDVPKLLQAEAMLPPNVDPLQADLAQPDERARLARLLSAGLRYAGRHRAAAEGHGGSGRPDRLAFESMAVEARAAVCAAWAIRRSGCGCRWGRCPKSCRRSGSRSSPSTRSRRVTRCPSATSCSSRKRRCAAASRGR